MSQALKDKILKGINESPDKKLEWNKLIPMLGRNEDRELLLVLRSMEANGEAYRVLERVGDTPETVLKIQLTKPPKSTIESATPPMTPTSGKSTGTK